MPIAEIAKYAQGGKRARRQGRLRPIRQVAAPAASAPSGEALTVAWRRCARPDRAPSLRLSAGAGLRDAPLVVFGAVLAIAPARRCRRSSPWSRIAAEGDAEIWPHLIANVLPASAARHARFFSAASRIVAGVIGVGTAWLVTAHRFPGRGMLVWLLAAAARRADLHHGLRLRGIFDSAGPVQMALRDVLGWKCRERLLVSGDALASRLHPRDVVRALPLCLHRPRGRCS